VSNPSDPPDVAEPRTTEAVTCLGCGCLCDDIVAELRDRSLVAAHRACEPGRAWFESTAAEVEAAPRTTVDGAAVSDGEALDTAAEILRRSRAPVMCGLTRTATETVREALALADRLGARVVVGRSRDDLGRVTAFQNAGRVSATLGEVRNRADVVVFWGCDPATTHPRHAERYSLEPRGRFVPDGRAGRFVIVIDDRPTETSRAADLVVHLPADSDLDLVAKLRAGLRSPSKRVSGLGDQAPMLMGRLTGARYGALFFRPRQRENARALWEGVAGLVRDLNEVARFVLLGLGAGGNLAGAEAALTWQGGFPQGVDYGPGFPAPVDESGTLGEILDAGETDAVVAVADPLPEDLSTRARAHLGRIPVVQVAPVAARRAGGRPTVAFTTAATGIEVAGSVTRVDGVTLPLRVLREPRYPTDRDWLNELSRRLGETHG
jgi:formylmethanofuran dehydrogenase subunit B